MAFYISLTIVLSLQVSLALDLVAKGPVCQVSHPYLCPCLFGKSAVARGRVDWLWRSYRRVLEGLSREERYTRDDFNVELLVKS